MNDNLGFYVQKLSGDNPVESADGESGYFSRPSGELDPHLFEGDKLKADVRRHLIYKLHKYWEGKGYKNASLWSRLFLAGSGITYQWDSSRGNGDLDVLLGFDYIRFIYYNEQFQGLDEDEIADYLNQEMHEELWPTTAETDFYGQTYEVTYYLNPGTGMDIRNIHPYAAYDVSQDKWVVRPPELPDDPKSLYPKEWFTKAGHDKTTADRLSNEYHSVLNELNSYNPGSPGYVNASSRMNLITRQAKDLFDDIHLGRKAAFRDDGKGYGDWHNFRWQVAKGSGAVNTLHSLSTISSEARAAQDRDTYGGEITDSAKALSQAAMHNWMNRRT